MKDQGKMKTLFFLAAAMSFTAFSQDWYQDISGAGFRQIRQNDTTVLELSGRTKQQKNTNYFIGTIHLDKPLNLTGKQVRLKITTSTPGEIIALAVRFYNAGEKTPCWSFMKWGKVFDGTGAIAPALFPGQNKILAWEKAKVNGKAADRVDTIRFWLGSVTPDVNISAVFGNFTISDAPQPRPAIAPYASEPAKVVHPVGSIKQADINRARENIRLHQWAREELAGLRKYAELWMKRTPGEITQWIPAEDAWFKCLCPNCGTQPEFAWRKESLSPDGKTMQCTKCKMVFPNEKYPEDRTYTIKTPRGNLKTIRYHHGKDQIAQGENYGPKYHISGAVNYLKIRQLPNIYSAAAVYALTGEKAYAQKTRDVLVRFAEVYPEYVYKFRATAYDSPEKHKMAGKLCAWKYHDSTILPQLLEAYSLTCNSGVYSDADKLKIENGICREYKHMIMAYPPTADWCRNAVPAHMTAAAYCAAMLGDHELMDWVLKGTEGFPAFLQKYYHRDGIFYENSAAYHNMATVPLYPLVSLLQGYSDPHTCGAPDRYDNLDLQKLIPSLPVILSGMAKATLPTGYLPAINDSQRMTRQPLRLLELASKLYPTAEMRELLLWFSRNYSSSWDLKYSLFLRDPKSPAESSPNVPSSLRKSTVFPGGGWAFLRIPGNAETSALVLTYGKYASHGHNSMLSYLYCDNGQEVISDLGYLSWWHPDRLWLTSPLAHNLVVVDKKPQDNRRIARPELFAGKSRIPAMRFNAPDCYPGVTKEYSRMMFAVPLSGKRQYLVDFFRVKGGSTHLWTFHADGKAFKAPDSLHVTQASKEEIGTGRLGSEWLNHLRKGENSAGTRTFIWQYDSVLTTALHFLTDTPVTFFLAGAPGLRDQSSPYKKVELNLLFAQKRGPDNTFVSIIENSRGKPEIRNAVLLKTSGHKASAAKVTTDSGTDLFLFAEPGGGKVFLPDYPEFTMTNRSGIVRLDPQGKVKYLWSEGNGELRFGNSVLKGTPPVTGRIKTIKGHRLFTNLRDTPAEIADNYLHAADHYDGLYRLSKAEKESGEVVLHLDSSEVIRLNPNDMFEIHTCQEKDF